MHDRRHDLPTQMEQLSRDTTAMLLATLNSVTLSHEDSEELYLSVINAVELDWDDSTHNVRTEFIPSSELGIPDCTRLTITVTNVIGPTHPTREDYKRIETVLTVSVLLGHLRTEYHTRYIPVDWSLTVMKTVENDVPQMFDQVTATGGVVIAILRSLAIQLGVPLAVDNKCIGEAVIDEMHTYGMPESNEMLFLRFGMDHLMEIVKNAESSNPSDTTD